MTSWAMEGPYLKACNCDPGCPCDFNQAPTHGHCHGTMAMRIDRGNVDDVSLDGVTFAVLLKWPGRIDEGDGHLQAIVDSEASDEQVSALETVMSGKVGGTLFEILDAVCPHRHETLRAPFTFEWELDSRTANIRAGDVFEAVADPLRAIGSDDAFRVRVQIPNGFEYTSEDETAEVAQATVLRSSGAVEMDVTDGNADLSYVRHAAEVPVPA